MVSTSAGTGSYGSSLRDVQVALLLLGVVCGAVAIALCGAAGFPFGLLVLVVVLAPLVLFPLWLAAIAAAYLRTRRSRSRPPWFWFLSRLGVTPALGLLATVVMTLAAAIG